jgi:hypothetical protein
MTERLKFLGRLEEKRLHAERLRLKMQGLRDSIRDILDPFEPLEEINLAIAAQQAMELASLQIELKATLEEIAAIRKALGREDA